MKTSRRNEENLPDPEDLPDVLTGRDTWINWKQVPRNGKLTKPPVDPSGRDVSATDPDNFLSFDRALEIARMTGDVDGVGYCFTSGGPYVGVDLDHCRDPETGEIAPWALNIVHALGSWTEVSPSGTGLHTILTGGLPGDGVNEGPVEVYDSGRYFTVTGRVLEEDAPGHITEGGDELRNLYFRAREASDDDPEEGPRTGEGDTPSVYDHPDLPREKFPENKRCEHPFHGSGTGQNFHVDSGGETYRCWRHDQTGNIFHLVAQSKGLANCGESLEGSDKWPEIFEAAREMGIEVPDREDRGDRPPEDWPEPILPSQPDPAQEVPLEVFPDPLQDYVREKSKATGASEEMVAHFCLGAISAAVGGSLEVQIKGEWTEGANVYAIAIAPSGCAKSPVLSGATDPVKTRHEELLQKFEDDQDLYSKVADAEGTKEKNLHDPVRKKAYTNDATTEGLGRDLEAHRRGVAMILDEAASWTGQMDKYRDGADRQFYLKCWGRESVQTSRKTEDEISVRSPQLTVMGAMTPSSLEVLVPEGESEEDGFLPRLLFVFPEEKPTKLTFDDEVHEDTATAYHNRLAATYGIQPEEKRSWSPEGGITGEFCPRRVGLSEEAQGVIESWYSDRIRPQLEKEPDPVMKAFLAKCKGYPLRLALLLHAVRNIAADAGARKGEEPPPIPGDIAEDATRLMEFYVSHFRRTLEEMRIQSKTGNSALEEYVLEKALQLEQERERFTERDLFKITRNKRDISDVRDLTHILKSMESDALLYQEKRDSTGGRPPSPWIHLNPRIERETPPKSGHKSHRSGGAPSEDGTSVTSVYKNDPPLSPNEENGEGADEPTETFDLEEGRI